MSEAEIGEGETEDPKLAPFLGNFHQVTQTAAASDPSALSLTWELRRQRAEEGGYPTAAVESKST